MLIDLTRLCVCIKEIAWVIGLYGVMHFGAYGFRKWYWEVPIPEIDEHEIALILSMFVMAVIILYMI